MAPESSTRVHESSATCTKAPQTSTCCLELTNAGVLIPTIVMQLQSSCSGKGREAVTMAQETLKLVSPSIGNEGRLPRKYTGDGQGARKDMSPPLEWYGVPEEAQSLALVVEDVDAPADSDGPGVPWTHWVVVNIPPGLRGLPEGFSGKEEAMGGEYAGIKEGNNDWKVPGWRGPKPPTSGHHIRFKLYALDQTLRLGNKVTKERLVDSMDGHVVGEAELVAMF